MQRPTFVGVVLIAAGAIALSAGITSPDSHSQSQGQGPDFKPHPAATRPPPEGEDRIRPEPRRRGPPDTLAARRAFEGTPRGKAKVEEARSGRGRPFAASSTPPPEFREAPEPPPRRPNMQTMSTEEFIDIVSKQPGGREKIEAVRRMNRPRGGTGTTAWTLADPLRGIVKPTRPAWMIQLWMDNAFRQGDNFATFNGARQRRWYLDNYTSSGGWGSFGHRVVNPVFSAKVTVPTTMWYEVHVGISRVQSRSQVVPRQRTVPDHRLVGYEEKHELVQPR